MNIWRRTGRIGDECCKFPDTVRAGPRERADRSKPQHARGRRRRETAKLVEARDFVGGLLEQSVYGAVMLDV